MQSKNDPPLQSEKTMIIALAAGSLFDTHLSESKATMEENEFNELKQKTGHCMGKIYTELLNPLWESNPKLRPTQAGGSHLVDDELQTQVIQLCKQLHSDL